jgi:hypothetical protein
MKEASTFSVSTQSLGGQHHGVDAVRLIVRYPVLRVYEMVSGHP